jgi:hypothetical protein
VRASPQRDLANPTPFLLIVIGPFVLCHSVLSLASITRFTGVVGRSKEPGKALETFFLPNFRLRGSRRKQHHEYTRVSCFRSRVSRECCAKVGQDTHFHHRRRPIHPESPSVHLPLIVFLRSSCEPVRDLGCYERSNRHAACSCSKSIEGRGWWV